MQVGRRTLLNFSKYCGKYTLRTRQLRKNKRIITSKNTTGLVRAFRNGFSNQLFITGENIMSCGKLTLNTATFIKERKQVFTLKNQ